MTHLLLLVEWECSQRQATDYSLEHHVISHASSHLMEVSFSPQLFEQPRLVRRKRNTVGLDKKIWNIYPSKDGRLYYVPYMFGSSYHPVERRRLRKAMLSIERRTCMRFWPVDPRNLKVFFPNAAKAITLRSYAVIVNSHGDGCHSVIGRHRGRNPVKLEVEKSGPMTCMVHRILLHELLHLLGLFHEHQRPDRDDHVIIHHKRVKGERRHNYDTEESAEMHGLPYDYNSECYSCVGLSA